MYKLLPILLFVVINFSFSSEIPKYNEPEFYSIIALRNYTLSENIPFSFWNEHIDLDYYYDLHEVKPKDKTWVFTYGYRKPFGNINYQREYIPFHNYFFGFEFEGLNWYEYDDYDGSMTWMNWTIGYGVGLKNKEGFQINVSAQYNFFTDVDYYDYGDSFELGANNYFSLNLGIGLTNKNTDWTKLGLHINKTPGKRYINADLPYINASPIPSLGSTEIGIEMSPLISGGGVLLFGLIYALAESGSDGSDLYSPSSSSSSSSSSSPKGCHVYGKIKIVEFGEDYKVKNVSFGENLKVKYVSFGEDNVGKWKIVEFGEDYKIKFVDFGEDIKVKFVDFGEGCN